MSESYRILAINPGSTTTKLALYLGEEEIHTINITHSPDELNQFPTVADQEEYRYRLMTEFLEKSEARGFDHLDAVIGRGGLLKPLDGGIYRINYTMLEDLRSARFGEHGCNLGALMAKGIADAQAENGFPCEALIADPVVVDELCPEARYSGMPEIERKSIFHALNQKSVARTIAKELGKSYEDLNLIVTHMGGGISVGAHRKGRVIDVNNALDGDGPFSPERAGTIPAEQLVSLVFSDQFTYEELKRMLTGSGGMYGYCGLKDMREVEERISSGNGQIKEAYGAMIYQIAQEIAKHGATLEGQVDAIVLTGGLAYSESLIEALKRKVSFLAPVYVIPGEREMYSLAKNALEALNGTRAIKEYD